MGSFLLCAGAAVAQSSMTDQQVLDYIRQGLSEGRQRQELTSELALKGVDRSQLDRVRRLYNAASKEAAASASAAFAFATSS